MYRQARTPAPQETSRTKPQRDHFSFLTGHAARLMVTGQADYPIERTLLTTGMLDFLVQSKAQGGKRLETPQLAVTYQPPQG